MLSAINFPLVYLISDGTLTDENFAARAPQFLKLVQTAVRANISIFQIREKQLSAAKIFELTESAARLTGQTQTLLLVNDRADIALAARGDGVQLSSGSLSAQTVRQNFPANFVIGASCHSLDEITLARHARADFATFSPIFATPSKAQYDLPPQGLNKLRAVCQQANQFPIIALGGINENNYRSCLQTGASGIAAIRFLGDAENLPRVVKLIRNE